MSKYEIESESGGTGETDKRRDCETDPRPPKDFGPQAENGRKIRARQKTPCALW